MRLTNAVSLFCISALPPFIYSSCKSDTGSWWIIWWAGQLCLAREHHVAAERPPCQAMSRDVSLLPKCAPLENALAIYHCDPSTAMRLHVPGIPQHVISCIKTRHLRRLLQAAVVVFFTLFFWGSERCMNEPITLFFIPRLLTCRLSYSNANGAVLY